jgi:hypothetical protein
MRYELLLINPAPVDLVAWPCETVAAHGGT